MKQELVAAWSVADFKEKIKASSDGSFIILTNDYQLIVLDENELAKFMNEDPK
jgi:hypothetical protein